MNISVPPQTGCWPLPGHPYENILAPPLHTPTARLTTMGHRAFSRAAPRLWNSLPANIRHLDSLSQFKAKLKTHLFTTAYPT